MNAESTAYFVKEGSEKEEGPFSAEQVRLLFRDGKLKGETLCRQTDGEMWTPLSELAADWECGPLDEATRLKGSAENYWLMAGIFGFLFLVTVFAAFVVPRENVWEVAAAAGGFFLIAFALGVIGQLIYIRAALEERK